jgi:hypothetical protein
MSSRPGDDAGVSVPSHQSNCGLRALSEEMRTGDMMVLGHATETVSLAPLECYSSSTRGQAQY